MILVGAVPGNEQQNRDFVVNARAGYACEAHEVGALLEAMRAREEIAAMGARARKIVLHQAAERVLDVCASLSRRRTHSHAA
jgi:UDP-N-acetylglucosamine:LPS N-acetylglucosamine transferase